MRRKIAGLTVVLLLAAAGYAFAQGGMMGSQGGGMMGPGMMGGDEKGGNMGVPAGK